MVTCLKSVCKPKKFNLVHQTVSPHERVGSGDKANHLCPLQREWMRMMIKALANESDYWYYTDLIYQQFEGLMYGYSQAAPSSQVSVLHCSILSSPLTSSPLTF